MDIQFFYFQSLIMYVILMLFYNLSTICALFLLLIEETCFLGGMWESRSYISHEKHGKLWS